MKRFLGLTVFAALTLTGNATFAADACTKIVATGHPQYPAIAYKEGDNIAGAAPTLVAAIAKSLNIPLELKYMGSWEEAQAAARDGKADMIFGIYYNDERAKYLDYVKPALMFDDVAVFVVKGKEFPFKGPDDLAGKKGVTNQGESYGNDFACLHKRQARRRPHCRHRRRLQGPDGGEGRLFDCRLLSRCRRGGQGRIRRTRSRPSTKPWSRPRCSSPSPRSRPAVLWRRDLRKGITELTTNDKFDAMLDDAIKAWDGAQAKK